MLVSQNVIGNFLIINNGQSIGTPRQLLNKLLKTQMGM